MNRHGTDRPIEKQMNELPKLFKFKNPKTTPTEVKMIRMIAIEFIRIGRN
jgi:hypothetical protein